MHLLAVLWAAPGFPALFHFLYLGFKNHCYGIDLVEGHKNRSLFVRLEYTSGLLHILGPVA